MKKRAVVDLFKLLDELIIYEKNHGVIFTPEGLPRFEKHMFADSVPAFIKPYSHRHDTPSKKETSICFYEHDMLLVRKLNRKKLERMAGEIREYHSFIGFDLSIFADFLFPMQLFFVLANLVINAFFVLNGCKMIPNLRADQTGGRSYFSLFANSPIACCGTLGCSKSRNVRENNQHLIKEYCHANPEKIVIQYGPKLVNCRNTFQIKPYGRRQKRYG